MTTHLGVCGLKQQKNTLQVTPKQLSLWRCVSRGCEPNGKMLNGMHLYSAFIQSALQFLPLIHTFTHTFTHQRQLAAMQGTNQLVRSNRGLGVLLRDTSTRPGWDRTGNLPTARRQLLPPEPYRPNDIYSDFWTLISAFTSCPSFSTWAQWSQLAWAIETNAGIRISNHWGPWCFNKLL